MHPHRQSPVVSSSNTLLGHHIRDLGFASIEAFIRHHNPEGHLEMIEIPGMPTVRLVRDGTPSKAEVYTLRQIVMGHVAVEGATYAVVQVA